MSAVHFADHDGDNFITSCGWLGGAMSGLVTDVTCKACKKTNRFKMVERGDDRRFEWIKTVRRGLPAPAINQQAGGQEP